MIIVLDFGGQYNQLIARRVRECNVYCEVHPYTLPLEKIKEMNPKGIIFTGGPNSVYKEESPRCSKEIFDLGIPVLGICYGAQLMSYLLGGEVATAPVSEYGKTEVEVDTTSKLYEGVSPKTICWMSHTDYISKMPEGFRVTAHTPVCPIAGMENEEKGWYGIQAHPEVLHTQEGSKMLHNFVYSVCHCAGDWKMDAFVEKSIEEIRKKVGNGRALLALSGGVDSSVAGVLMAKAIGDQLQELQKKLIQGPNISQPRPLLTIETPRHLGEQLNARRKELGIDLYTLELQTGISTSTLKRLFKDPEQVKFGSVFAVANVLGVKLCIGE